MAIKRDSSGRFVAGSGRTSGTALQVAFKVKTVDQFKRYLKGVNNRLPSTITKAAALVRKTAKWSIRTRKGISKPGGPPHSHTGLLKRNIFYEVDRARLTAFIGPVRLNAKGKDVPAALEYGGKSQSLGWAPRGKTRKVRKFKVKARPFMGPALKKVQTKLVKYWRGSTNR